MHADFARGAQASVGSHPSPATNLLARPLLYWGLAAVYTALFAIYQFRLFGLNSEIALLSADDGMRLQGVRDLLAGQAWFDTHQYRYLPPAGTLMHWSRLLDAPLAGTLWLFRKLVAPDVAETLLILVWPTALFIAYLGILVPSLIRIVGPRAAALALILATLTLQSAFAVGSLDYHNVQVILATGLVACFALARTQAIFAVLAGACAAFSLALGLETLPIVAAVGVIAVALWVRDPGEGSSLALFAGTLFAVSVVAYGGQISPTLWFTSTCDALGPPVIVLVTGAAIAAVGLAVLGPHVRWQVRLGVAALAGAVVVGSVAWVFPECLGGPYSAVPEPYRTMWLHNIPEARSFVETMAIEPGIAWSVLGPMLAATAAATIGAIRLGGPAQRLMMACAVLLAVAIVLSLFEIRAATHIGVAFVPIAAGWALDRLLTRIVVAKAPAAVGLFCAGAIFFQGTWLSAAELVPRPRISDPLAQSARNDAQVECVRDLKRLDLLAPATILAPIDIGAHILFLTKHSIVASGYHRAPAGIVAGFEFFRGSEAEIKSMAQRFGAGYIASCPGLMVKIPGSQSGFVKALLDGASTDWLEPVPLGTTELKVWRVRTSASAAFAISGAIASRQAS